MSIFSAFLSEESARELGELDDPDKRQITEIVSRKTVEVIADDGNVYTEKQEQIQLVGSVKYDAKQQFYYDR